MIVTEIVKRHFPVRNANQLKCKFSYISRENQKEKKPEFSSF